MKKFVCLALLGFFALLAFSPADADARGRRRHRLRNLICRSCRCLLLIAALLGLSGTAKAQCFGGNFGFNAGFGSFGNVGLVPSFGSFGVVQPFAVSPFAFGGGFGNNVIVGRRGAFVNQGFGGGFGNNVVIGRRRGLFRRGPSVVSQQGPFGSSIVVR